ncbi:alpha/beta hydrolase [Aliidiomarina taiwanensis]|nr:alpha/beta hydrolase [Aliidiomarina taiwanensis]
MRLLSLCLGSAFIALSAFAPAIEASALSLTPCHVKGHSEQVQCGYLPVPENYAEPEGKTINIHVVLLPAVAAAAEKDPLLFLAGGPGQAATELTGLLNTVFRDVRQTRDILLIDQRGTGKSNPLSCEMGDMETVWDTLLLEDDEVDIRKEITACADALDADLQHYNTLNAVRDFDAVRAALGYEQVNLYGGSYGTRSGLAYMREFPDRVRTAVLDGVAPPQVKIGLFGASASAAFQRMLRDCAEQEACQQAFPNLAQDYQALVERLATDSEVKTLPDPRSHRPTDIRFTPNRVNQMIFPALYSPRSRQLLPFAIDQAAQGNYSPLLGVSGPLDAESPIYLGLHLSVVCQEDIPRIVATDFEREAQSGYLGSAMMENYIAMCEVWPVQVTEADAWQPVQSDVPSLLLSGEQDPVTPPAWAELAAETLTQSTHVVAAAGGHTIATHTCANELVAAFIADPSAELDTSCLAETQVLPYLLNVNGQGM